eukprot:gi/632969507/ref/XP_007901123.1/ PREDICTED: roquin-1 isoform X3 [Callorhinchus milii]
MPVQAPQWTDFLSCPICCRTFDENVRKPISLGCGHTLCSICLNNLHRKACPFDHTTINTHIDKLPVNSALLQLVGAQVSELQCGLGPGAEASGHYEVARKCVEELALYLKPLSGTRGTGPGAGAGTQSALSRPVQRKLVTLLHCQLVEEEGRARAMRAARSLGERTVTELILQHQNPQQLSANLWAAVRARGCQFLGPAMQEEAVKLVLLALEDGSALCRKVLVLFAVQRLEPRFPQASKTSIGHVVQLLYRASCFQVTKRDEDSSLMQLKEEFRVYEALRREHDSQIVQIAMEAGLRIAPDQWSSLLYGDLSHKSHMQSIIDKLQTPASFAQSVQELTIALQRTGDPANLTQLRPHLERLANIDPSPEVRGLSWEQLEAGLVAVKTVVQGLGDFILNHSKRATDPQQPAQSSKYKTSVCRDLRQGGGCPRGVSCTFAHSQEELERFRVRTRRGTVCRLAAPPTALAPPSSGPPHSTVTPSNDSHNIGSHGNDGNCDGNLELSISPTRVEMPAKRSLGAVPPSIQSRVAPDLPPVPASKHTQLVPRGSHMYPPAHQPDVYYQDLRGAAQQPDVYYQDLRGSAQQPDVYYQDPRGSTAPYKPAAYHPSLYYPPASGPLTAYVPHYRGPSSMAEPGYRDQYVAYTDRMGSAPYPLAPPYPLPQPLPPHCQEHRAYPAPTPYPSEDIQHPVSRYRPEPRDPYTHDNYYTGTSPHHRHLRPHYRDPHGRTPSLDYLHRRRNELMAQLKERRSVSPPSFPLATYPQCADDDVKANSHYKAHEYSPWSCDTIGSYIGGKDSHPKEMVPVAVTMDAESRAAGEGPRAPAEGREEDPIIPFGELPTVSRFGAIARTSKPSYQPGPGTANVSYQPGQGLPTTHTSTADYSAYRSHAGWGATPTPTPTQGHLVERERLCVTDTSAQTHQHVTRNDRQRLRLELQYVNQQISQHQLEVAGEPVLWQREALGWQPTGPSPLLSRQQLSRELYHVEREIGKRTQELEPRRALLDVQCRATENVPELQPHGNQDSQPRPHSEGSMVAELSFIAERTVSALTLVTDSESGERCHSHHNGASPTPSPVPAQQPGTQQPWADSVRPPPRGLQLSLTVGAVCAEAHSEVSHPLIAE